MNLPVLSSEGNLAVYLQEIKKFPMLTAEEEYMLAKPVSYTHLRAHET